LRRFEAGPLLEMAFDETRQLDAGLTGPAFVTFPADRHEVQTRTRLRVPFSVTIRADWRFGSQRRRVRLLAWLTLFPERGPLPQTAQSAAMIVILSSCERNQSRNLGKRGEARQDAEGCNVDTPGGAEYVSALFRAPHGFGQPREWRR